MMSNPYGIDYDFPGFCCKCHTQIAEFKRFKPNMIPEIDRLLPIACQETVVLDDGSKMKVMLCKDCQENLAPEHMQEIMESVQRGWQWEVNNVVQWEEDKKQEYLKEYRKRHIVRSDTHSWSKEKLSKLKKPRKDKQEVRKR